MCRGVSRLSSRLATFCRRPANSVSQYSRNRPVCEYFNFTARLDVRPFHLFASALKCNEDGRKSGDGSAGEDRKRCCRTAALLAAAGAVTGAVAAISSDAAACEAGDVVWTDSPLMKGISDKQVKDYVDDILANGECNLKWVPDSIERVIFESTVRITLNAVYRWISYLHGIKFWGHHLSLEMKEPVPDADSPGLKFSKFSHDTGSLNEEALDELTHQLLANKSINQWIIPDFIERDIYKNCLRLVFRLIDKVANTISIRLCGHELSLSFEPLTKEQVLKMAGDVHNGNSRSRIDNDVLEELVSDAMHASAESKASSLRFLPFYSTFVKGLHKTLYSLIFGILDDIFLKTEIVVLQDTVKIKLLPNPRPTKHQTASPSATPPTITTPTISPTAPPELSGSTPKKKEKKKADVDQVGGGLSPTGHLEDQVRLLQQELMMWRWRPAHAEQLEQHVLSLQRELEIWKRRAKEEDREGWRRRGFRYGASLDNLILISVILYVSLGDNVMCLFRL